MQTFVLTKTFLSNFKIEAFSDIHFKRYGTKVDRT